MHPRTVRIEAHVDVARARLRKNSVVRSVAHKLDGGRTFLVVQPMGSPRLWNHSTNAVVSGFTEALAASPGLRGVERLRSAVAGARDRLVKRCETLIEHDLPDVGVLALSVDGGELHVHTAGPCRAYLHRHRHTERITSRDEEPGGLLVRGAAESSVWLDPGDLVLAGTLSAFSAAAVERVVSVLDRDQEASPQVVAQLLTEPADQAGTGAAVVVLRAR